MLSRKVPNTLLQRVYKSSVPQMASMHHEKRIIGNREIVGFGVNGSPHYIDRLDVPFPAIRFREIKGDLVGLKEKEKLDWKKLTINEKKALYRASFCKTFSELRAPTGEWKQMIGFILMGVSAALWLFMATKKFAAPPLPSSFSEESRAAQLRRTIDLRINPISGIPSKWDYEKDDWKK